MLSCNNSMASLADFLFSGVLVRFPRLKLAYSEGQIGWIPYALERADNTWEYHAAWTKSKDAIPEPPSTYYWGRIYGCFFDDAAGLASIDAIGPDQVTFETDYPHADGTWPHSKQVAEKLFAGLPQELVDKICRDNALRLFGTR
jgi:predicted TIM-barrel fold metal-dependent hydrolase